MSACTTGNHVGPTSSAPSWMGAGHVSLENILGPYSVDSEAHAAVLTPHMKH